MSSRMTTLQMIGCTAALAAVGSVYVLLELASRKQRKERKETEELEGGEGSSNSLTADKLVEVLGESARAAYSLIEQTRKMVQQKHQETGQPLETCVDELQKGFESAMEQVIASIRQKHSVTEAQMTAAMNANLSDPRVTNGIKALREAMNGTAPPGYSEAVAAEATEQRRSPARRSKNGGRRNGGR